MIIEIIITLLLATIFYLYLSKWPEAVAEKTDPAQVSAQEALKDQLKRIRQPVSEDPEVVELVERANEFFAAEEWKKAEKLYLKAAAKDPKCVKAYSRLGVIYLKIGKEYDDAKEAFKRALKLDPNNGYILNNLGLVYYNQEKNDQAIDCFQKAIKIDGNQASRHANLGIVYYAKRQYAKAERSLKKAIALDPDNHEYQDLLREAAEKKNSHRLLFR